MKKQLMNTTQNKLALAKAEFKQFQKKQAQHVQQSAPPVPASAPTTAYKVLHCSMQSGKLSRLDFKLSESVATSIKATALQTQPASPGTPQAADLDSLMLKSKVEISGSYNGCPHCGKTSFCYCSYCGAISCSTGGTDFHKCPDCKREFHPVPLTDAIELCGNRQRPQQPTTAPTSRASLPRCATKALPKKTHKALLQQRTGLLPKK